MTRDIILKRYERGMKPAQIAASDGIPLDFVKEIIATSDVRPIKRCKQRKSVLITDDEIARRLQDGETRYAIEQDFDLTPGTLASRANRILRDLADGPLKPTKPGRKLKHSDEEVKGWVDEGKTLAEIRKLLNTTYKATEERLAGLGIQMEREGTR